MVSKTERMLAAAPFSEIRKMWISRARLESGRIADTRQWMSDNGFEMLNVSADALLADDGREILHAHGKAWALRPEIHAKRLAEAMEQARQRDHVRPPDAPTCVALVDGQLCGGTLVRAAVCPRCALGKSGIAATLTCDVCGHVTAIMREAK